MANELFRRGQRVALLALIDANLPAVMPAVPYEEATLLVAFAAHHGVTISQEVLRGLPSAERLPHVSRLAVDAGTLSPNTDNWEFKNRFRVFVANVTAGRSLHAATLSRPDDVDSRV